MNRQATICLHDFIPGTVQKIAFDQNGNKKIAMIYRILKNEGYIYRTRVYDVKGLSCESGQNQAFESEDDIEARYEEVAEQQWLFVDSNETVVNQ